MCPQPHPGEEVVRFARAQHDVIRSDQLRGLGVHPRAITRWMDSYRLFPVHRGVYAVGRPTLNARGRWMAAVLACGNGAFLSHRSAAALWGLMPVGSGDVHVTVETSGRRKQKGIAVHTTRELPGEHGAELERIPLTSVARTIGDLSFAMEASRLANVLETAERLRLLDANALARARCSKALKVLLGEGVMAADTRSKLEERFLSFCEDEGLPRPATNVVVAGHDVDAFWPGHALVVELDSFEFHRTRASFERDRSRDRALQLAGYRVVRVTDRMLRREPAQLAAALRALLS